MRGSIAYQVNRLFLDSGIFTPGVSKHNEKAIARKNGANTWHTLGKALNIYSFETTKTYRATWFDCAKWLKANEYSMPSALSERDMKTPPALFASTSRR